MPDYLEVITRVVKRLKSSYEKLSIKCRRLDDVLPRLNMNRKYAERFVELLGSCEEAYELLTTDLENSIRTIRVNTLKISRSKLASRLREKHVETKPIPYTPYGLLVTSSPYSIGALHEYLQGLYTVQGPASMLVVLLLYPYKGPILDMCAGAGIKTTQLAQHNPQDPIIAIDVNKRKLMALKNHASRLGVTNVISLNMDARNVERLGMRFSTILLDAPCTGEGLIPFKRGRQRYRRLDDIIDRVTLQIQLLSKAVEVLDTNGVLVYATCSMAFEENELVVSTIMELYDDVKVEKPVVDIGAKGITEYIDIRVDDELSKCVRLFPHMHKTEGFTICRLRKVG